MEAAPALEAGAIVAADSPRLARRATARGAAPQHGAPRCSTARRATARRATLQRAGRMAVSSARCRAQPAANGLT